MGEFIGALDLGHHQHPLHDLRPRRRRSSAVDQKEHRQIYPAARLGRARPAWRSGSAPSEVIRGALAKAGIERRRHRGHRHHQPARDHRGLGPRAPASRTATPSSGRTPAPTRSATTLGQEGGQDRFRAKTGLPAGHLFLRPQDHAGSWTTCPARAQAAEQGEAALRQHRHLGHLEPDRRAQRRRARHRRHQRQPHHADEPATPWTGMTRSCEHPGHPAADAAAHRAVHRRRRLGHTADGRLAPRCRSAATWATSRRPWSARPASPPAKPRTPTAPAASCCSTPATEPVPASHGLLTTVGYKIGGQPAGLLPGRLHRHHRRPGAVAARQPGPDPDVSETSRTLASERATTTAASTSCPAFSGLFAPYWRSDARGVIVGLTRYINQGHIARAALEATAYQTREVLDAMDKDSGVTLTSPARWTAAWCPTNLLMQFQADILGVPVVRPKITETTALGAAYGRGPGLRLRGPAWMSSNATGLWTSAGNPPMAAEQRQKGIAGWKKAVERHSTGSTELNVDSMQFSFATAHPIVFGPGTLAAAVPHAGRRAMVVTGRTPERATPLGQGLEKAGVKLTSKTKRFPGWFEVWTSCP
ncbi:MAG: FGGY-family carbohydrate kinase [Desulfobacterales bacterium]|nr:FGGY-family carbohydrate kinase [Desulfobacterales bacterium]